MAALATTLYLFLCLMSQKAIRPPSSGLDLLVLFIPALALSPAIWVLRLLGFSMLVIAGIVAIALPVGYLANLVVWRGEDIVFYCAQLALGLALNAPVLFLILLATWKVSR